MANIINVNRLLSPKFTHWTKSGGSDAPENWAFYDNGGTGTAAWSRIPGGGPIGVPGISDQIVDSWRLAVVNRTANKGFQTNPSDIIKPNEKRLYTFWFKGDSQPIIASNGNQVTTRFIVNPTVIAGIWQQYIFYAEWSGLGGGLSGGDFFYVFCLPTSFDVQLALPTWQIVKSDDVEGWYSHYYDGDTFGAKWDGVANRSYSTLYGDLHTEGDSIDEEFEPLRDSYGELADLKIYSRAMGRAFQPIAELSRDETLVSDVAQTVLRTNKIISPSFERDYIGSRPSGWVSGWAEISEVSNAWSVSGEKSARLRTNSMGPGGQNSLQAFGPDDLSGLTGWAIGPNSQITLRAIINLVSRTGNGAVYTQVNFYNGAATYISSFVGNFGTTPGIFESYLQGMTPAGTAFVTVYIVANEGSPNPPASQIEAYVDDVFFAFGNYPPGTYFDGDTLPKGSESQYRTRWTETQQLSSSELVTVATTEKEQVGWSQLLDLNRARSDWLRWLGQWVGYYISENPPNLALERERIVSRSAHRRGSIALIREAVQEHLKGAKSVIIQERFAAAGSTAYQITVSIYTAEIVTSAAAAEAAARAQKPAGLIMTFNALSTSQWNTLTANQATWNVVTGKFANWNEVLSNPAKP